MKVLHITTSSKGGAGIAAKRLHDALHENGVQSGFLSSNLTIDFTNQIVNDPFFAYRKPSLFKKACLKFESVFFPSQFQKSSAQFQKIKDKLQYEIATLPFSNYKLHEHPLVIEADIINLHWIGGLVDYRDFFEHCRKPIVWTLHDMNPFQGIFHYKHDELRNKNVVDAFDRSMKEVKVKGIQTIKYGATVTPSKWLLDEAVKHGFFSQSIKESIPNAIDLNVFKIQNVTSLKKKLGIAENEFVLLFVSDSLENPRKGFDLLLEALNLLGHLQLTIVTIGKGVVEGTKFKNVSLGLVESAEKMASYYAMADAFVLPSREDNLPNVMLEAFACGTPVISFNHGGMKEHIHENLTGILAKEVSGTALADAIEQFYITRQEYKRDVVRKCAEDNFNFAKQAGAYFKLYNQLKRDNESQRGSRS